jgi:hypothetical protein
MSCGESWERLTDEPDIRGVDAQKITHGNSPTGVWSSCRRVPADRSAGESELRQQMAAALGAVDGVERVWEEDREVWGSPALPQVRLCFVPQPT